MKENKAFFNNNDNRLNKGYAKASHFRSVSSGSYRRQFEHVLPPIDLISQYEDLNPGTLKRLIELAAQEQKNKYNIELINLENKRHSIKFGQIAALISILIACVSVVTLIICGAIKSAIIFSIITLTALSVIFYLNKKAKYNTPYENIRYNNESEDKRKRARY
jgi:uncharacterized membrane protein